MKLNFPLDVIFRTSIDKFLTYEIDNILNRISERNLCGRLSIYITETLNDHGIKGYFADTEYNRKQNGQVKTILDNDMNVVSIQCDLIVHSRGKNLVQDNLIAIEMKKSNRPEHEKVSDKMRLRALTKDSYDDIWSADGIALPEHVCGYGLGAYIELDIRNRSVIFEYFKKGNLVDNLEKSF